MLAYGISADLQETKVYGMAIVLSNGVLYTNKCKFSQFASNPVLVAMDMDTKVKRSSFMRSRGLREGSTYGIKIYISK
jgi:hypothetical protein